MDELQKARNTLEKKYHLQAELSEMERFHTQNIEQLNLDKADKKEKRQTALAYGENVSKLTNALIRIDSKIEESEDAIVGIRQRQAELKPDIINTQKEIANMELEAEKAKLWKVARKYNEKAQELSEIVREFWDLHDHLECGKYIDGRYIRINNGVFCDDFYSGALNKIPALKIGSEAFSGGPYNKEYFFVLYNYRNYEKRNRNQAAVVQKAPVIQESPENIEETDEAEFETEEYIEDEEYSEDEDEDFEDDSDAEDSEET